MEAPKKAIHRFPKQERLSSKKLIKELFDEGSSFYLHPFKVFFLQHPEENADHHQVLISVPKKVFKKASTRNLIKRRIREAYRLNKHLLEIRDFYFLIGYIYVGKEVASYKSMEDKLIETLLRLNSKSKN